MQSTTTTHLLPLNEPPLHLTLRQRKEASQDRPEEPDIQPFIARLRIIYLKHIDNTDDLSLLIHAVASKCIHIDCSKISQLSEMNKITQECKQQFAQVLYSDFDFGFLKTPNDFNRAILEQPVELRGWKFEEWQIKDFIKLDKYFGQLTEQRQEALSPFDQGPIPEQLPKHEFAQEIVDLLRTIPEFPQEQALATKQTATFARPNTENENVQQAYQRWNAYKRMANCAVQSKKNQVQLAQLKIDIPAQKLDNENYLQEIIKQEAQRLMVYIEELEKVKETRDEEIEQARAEIATLKTQLEESAKNCKKLQADLAVTEKRSKELEQELNVQRANYIHLAQEIQRIRSSQKKKKPWWQFW